jgi:transcription factor CRZ1
MDGHGQYSNRGRSPSASVNSRNVSPSPHHSPYHDAAAAGLMLDSSSLVTTAGTYPNLTLPSSLVDANAYGVSNAFLAAPSHTSENLVPQNDQFSSSFAATFADQIEQSTAHHEGNYSMLNANPADYDFSQYAAAADNTGMQPNFDSSLLLDPQQQQSQQATQGAQLMSQGDMVGQMGSPHLLSPEHHSSPGNSHTSPPITSGPFYSPGRSRSASLDPMSAAYMGNPAQEWQGMLENPAFQSHRRAPSEHSDVSSVSHHSPYMGQQESFEALDGASPSLAAQNDPILYDNTLAMDGFTLSEQQQQLHQQGLSPNHSPYISPQLPSQDLNNEAFILSGQQNMTQFPVLAHDAYQGPPGDGAIATMQAPNIDMGQMNNNMAPPPSINVEFAPPSRVPSFGPGNENDFDALSPPSRKWD